MPDVHLAADHINKTKQACEEIWMLGQPPLQDYLDFVRRKVVNGAVLSPKKLVDEWRIANDYYYDLEETEAGITDKVEYRDLGPEFDPLVEKVMSSPQYRNTFDTLPNTFAMVELDRLVVFQPHVARHFVEDLKARLGPKPSLEALFNFCFPLGQPNADVRIQKIGSGRYIFQSQSSDFRFHEPVLLKPDQVTDYESFGSIAGIVGLVIGFGPNFLTVLRSDNRLMLHNGYHRACALRALGITHAPCLVQTVTRLDELYLSASRQVAKSPAFYFKAPRPPLLKDFFDPKIRKVLPTNRLLRMIEVKFEVEDHEVAE
jgi:hypothetical protein